jgi:hypothetical protein
MMDNIYYPKNKNIFKIIKKCMELLLNIPKRDVEEYISRIEDSKHERQIIRQEIQKILDRKREHERRIKAGEEDPLYEIEQKAERVEMQKQRFITDLNNMENSKQIFNRQARINNINRIKRE